MARRRRADSEPVSLFPFLSILACVIGVLTLLITAVAIGQLDPAEVQRVEQDLEEAQRRAEAHQTATQQAGEVQKELDEIRRLLAEAEAVREQLARARAEAARLEKQRDAALAESKEAAALLAEANRMRQRATAIEEELAAKRKAIEQLEARIAERKKPPDPAVVRIQPGGTGTDLDPTFVECTAGGVVLLDSPGQPRVRQADLARDPTFLGLLDRIADTKKGTVIFLVRSDAVRTYQLASRVARQRYCRNGKLPVVGEGKIDLGMFRK